MNTTPNKRAPGRPPMAPDERLVQRSIRLSKDQWAKIDAGGLGWLRGVINRAKPPKQ